MLYASLLVSVVLMGLASAAAAPTVSTALAREREAELEFRLAEYRSAIARYRADHNRYPKTLEALLVDSSRPEPRRYLRRLYPDPFTGKVDWALDLVQDRTGAVAGIEDLHSRSTARPMRELPGKTSYRDW